MGRSIMQQPHLVLTIFLALYLAQALFSWWLDRLNLRHMERFGKGAPPCFEGMLDASKLSKITAYTRAKTRLGILSDLTAQGILLLLILSGFMTALGNRLFSHEVHSILAGLLFFTIPGFLLFLAELPFDYYHTFVIEEAFGFNRTTLRTWVVDHLKSGLVSLCLFTVILSATLTVVQSSPTRWWLWAFAIVSGIQIVLVLLYPVVLAPLFNKFVPLQDNMELSEKIGALMQQNGIQVRKILQMDAGRRSRHTNAYFTGLGKTKQIVLYDTLLEAHSRDEILSVLAHEVGHYKEKHVPKQLLFFELSLLAGFYLTYRIMEWPAVYAAFGFESSQTYAGLFLVGIAWQKAGFFLQPFYTGLSRHFERQADLFAARFLKTPDHLVAALKRMALDNLSNLAPHPLYVRFHYSHPPLVERITFLDTAGRSSGAEKTGSTLERRH
ncbi:M48 family metallopeptidase [Desulforhabdus sp. TSK]|uniref:M48 family metallopeptidase n=1 Tax=Desulforhabdus sp. TSK TaxID=2925014 RepID=UPI001FC7E5DA|nr:M48 family metallopeptidase [Desulforhabdus sp. TSK]